MVNWRNHPQEAQGFLYIMKPRVVFRARVNMPSPIYPLGALTYDSVSYGSYLDLEMGMTILIGSTEGAYDLGRSYVRGNAIHVCASATTINLGYSSQGRHDGEVDLQDNAFITVLDLFEPWFRPSKGGSAPGSVLKDYDWTATNRHSPVVMCGNTGGIGTMAFVENGVTRQSFDARGSHTTNPVDPGWVDQRWDMKDGSFVSGNILSDTAVVDFGPGYRWIKRTVIDGEVNLGLPRRFCVVGLETSGDHAPISTGYRIRWSRKLDGQVLTAQISQRLNPSDYLPGTVVMLLVKMKYGTDEGSATGYELAFAGYLDGSVETGRANIYDTERGSTLRALDLAGFLKKMRGFPSRMDRVASLAFNANQMTAATVWRYIWWMLYWHTSAPMLSDIFLDYEDPVSSNFSFFSNSGGSVYAICDALAMGIGKRLSCDSLGVLRVRYDDQRLEVAERISTVQADVLESDWTDLDRAPRGKPPVGWLRGRALPTSTVPVASLTSTVEELHAIAPGIVAGAGTGEEQLGYLSLTGTETDFWKRLGKDYGRRNSPEEKLSIRLAHGGDVGIEPAKRGWITVTASEENVGWLATTMSAVRCQPQQVDFDLDDEAGTLSQRVIAERETFGAPGTRDPRAVVDPPRIIRPPVVPIAPPYYNPIPNYNGDVVPTQLWVLSQNNAKSHIARSWNPLTLALTYEEISTGLSGGGIWGCGIPTDWRGRRALMTDGVYGCPDIWNFTGWTQLATPTAIFGDPSGIGGAIFPSINLPGYYIIPTGTTSVAVSFDECVTWQCIDVQTNGAGTPGTSLAAFSCSVGLTANSNPSSLRVYAIIGAPSVGVELHRSDDGGLTWTLVANNAQMVWDTSITATPRINVPYVRFDGTQNIDDANQEIFLISGHSTRGQLIFSNTAGATWTTIYYEIAGGGQAKPRGSTSGYPLMTFTHDPNIIFWGSDAGYQHSSDGGATRDFENDVFNVGAAVEQNIMFNGFSNHRGAMLGWNKAGSAGLLGWSMTGGATWSNAAALPSTVTFLAYAEWDLSTLNPPLAA